MKSGKIIGLLIMVFFSVGLGCSRENQLIGVWESEPAKFLGMDIARKIKEFTPLYMIEGKKKHRVEYKAGGGGITLIKKDGSRTYIKVINPSTIAIGVPGLGETRYHRIQ